ncbi:MAG: hypothetical protein OHK0039_07180 [Bacteroidia bacterium]
MSTPLSKTPVVVLAFANERSEGGFLRGLTLEMKAIMRALEPAVQKGRCHLRIIPAASQEEIAAVFQDAWYEGRVWIFHYGGHADEDELWLEKDAGGGNRSFFSLGLARFLGAQRSLRLVFLNGCATGDHVRHLLDARIPAVIATSRKIDDRQAQQFATSFYLGLASGASIEEAFQEAEGLLLGQHGPQPFQHESGTRSLFWDEELPSTPDPLDLPWKLSLRQDESWIAAQWRLFYELKDTDASAPVQAAAFVGETIGNYQIEEVLGEGAMGTVYRVIHTELNEERAMKIMHPAKEGYERFKSIIIAGHKGLAAIRHANVAAVYDVGEINRFGKTRLYMVMELVRGTRLDKLDLCSHLDSLRDIERMTDIFVQIATGLEAAHKTKFTDDTGMAREGILHGNIKSRKILFTPEGVPKLIDFLFADLTRTRNIELEQPESIQELLRAERLEDYLAPEWISGQTGITRQTDIFALGAVFFEAVTGRKVADHSLASTDDMLHLLREQHRLFPRHIARAIYLATHPDPATRYQSAGQLIDDLLRETSWLKRLQFRFRRK